MNLEKLDCPGTDQHFASIMLTVKSSLMVWCLAAGALIAAGCTTTEAASTDPKSPEAILASGGVPEGSPESSKQPSGELESTVKVNEDGSRDITIAEKGDEKPLDPEKVAKGGSSEATGGTAAAPAGGSGKPNKGEEVVVFETSKGRIVAKFRPDKAPKHVANFKDLVG